MKDYVILALCMIAFQISLMIVTCIVLYRQSVMKKHLVSMPPFWKTFQTKVVSKLHHPHPESKELDNLMEKLESLTLSVEEKCRLKVMLQKITEDPKSDERDLAQLLLIAMPRVSRERGEPPTPVNGIPVSQLN